MILTLTNEKKTLVPTISELKVHKGIVLSKQQSNSQLSEICLGILH